MNGWSVSNPPQDGSIIVAIGRVCESDGDYNASHEFCAAIFWQKDDSGFIGWHYLISGLTVIQYPDQTVQIDYWTEHPLHQLADSQREPAHQDNGGNHA